MNRGHVYDWVPDPALPSHGRIRIETVALEQLVDAAEGQGRLWGKFVRVRNASWVKEQDARTGKIRPVPLGDAQPDVNGDFLFDHGRGGPRVDKVEVHEFQDRYIRAARFGEVNTYYHLNRIAQLVHELLAELGAPPLPSVIAVVNAHHAATDVMAGIRDGVLKPDDRWVPFQGGHYRLASRRYDIPEHDPVSLDGEIHLGAGRQLWKNGALAELLGRSYRANASHNAGIIYHEYGHHITRHTADFRGNNLRPPDNQDNRKSPIDEGTCDYWAATMLDTPHIWAWHQAQDHPRSLASEKGMTDFDHDRSADPHSNGTIWGAALWDLRTALAACNTDGARKTNLLLLQALLLIGKMMGDENPPTPESVRAVRGSYDVGLGAMLSADENLFGGRHCDLILETFARRGISPGKEIQTGFDASAAVLPKGKIEPKPIPASLALSRAELLETFPAMRGLLKHVPLEEIPETADLFSGDELEQHLETIGSGDFSLVAVGDIMLGGRSRKFINEFGAKYVFECVRPLFRRTPIGLANLEGPIAREAEKLERNYSYRVSPRMTKAMLKAGINVVTLANNHLLDCGRDGVLESLQLLREAGVAVIGAGENKQTAHTPAIVQADNLRLGFLGYYWNRRTAARGPWPGSAMDTPPELLAADIAALKGKVDRIVATFHWGVPYVREPSEADRAKARFAVDCGADIVIGHHPHLVQPFEIYRGRPIFYSVGNFTFGSGNSRGESLLLGLRFQKNKTSIEVYPAYVKNRDPRVHYQPKILRGAGAQRLLRMLAEISGESGAHLKIENSRGVLELQWSEAS
jgi:hypothetical protein